MVFVDKTLQLNYEMLCFCFFYVKIMMLLLLELNPCPCSQGLFILGKQFSSFRVNNVITVAECVHLSVFTNIQAENKTTIVWQSQLVLLTGGSVIQRWIMDKICFLCT